MKTLVLVGSVLFAFGCSFARPPDGGGAAEVARFVSAYREALEAGDEAALRGMYVDDSRFAWYEDGALRYASPDEVLTALAAAADLGGLHTDYEDVRVFSFGGAGARVAMRFVTTVGEGASAYTFGGVVTMVVEKGGGGWRVVGGHTSTARLRGE